jgi:hypothetical protein
MNILLDLLYHYVLYDIDEFDSDLTSWRHWDDDG